MVLGGVSRLFSHHSLPCVMLTDLGNVVVAFCYLDELTGVVMGTGNPRVFSYLPLPLPDANRFVQGLGGWKPATGEHEG